MIKIIQPYAMPPQEVPAMPPGATSIYSAGLLKGQAQTDSQMALIGKSGGRRMTHRRKTRGGSAPVIQVPSIPAGTLNPIQTANNYKEITQLAQLQSQQAVYDSAKTPAQTASIAAVQNALYSGKGGRKSRNRGLINRRSINRKPRNRKSRRKSHRRRK
jgi:hypothetical protein